jgi:YHS domain-containing protein
VRLALLALWVAVIVAALVPVLRRAQRPGAPPRIASDELVQDPVCGTYVVRSRAVSRGAAEGPHYFCSVECAGRFPG